MRKIDARGFPNRLPTWPDLFLLANGNQASAHLMTTLSSVFDDRLIRLVADMNELIQRLRFRNPSSRPALLLIDADSLGQTLLSECQPLLAMQEGGWLGIVVLLRRWPDDDDELSGFQEQGIEVLPWLEDSAPVGAGHLLRSMSRTVQERFEHLRQQERFERSMAEHRVMEARLNFLTRHDALTALANRQSFETALEAAIIQGRERGYTHAVLYLDLDRFKFHNEATSHDAGNVLLQCVANRLRQVVPPECLLARLGSDEFAVLLQGIDEQQALHTAEQLREMVAAIEPDAREIVYHVGVSIGLALIVPGEIDSASQALAQAEQACFVAKGRGGNCVHRFSLDDVDLQHLREDMHWADPIRTALAGNHLFLNFQPLLSVADERITHYEALVRIPARLGGNEASAQFMMAAERLGLAIQVDQWVLDASLAVLARHPQISLGVNLSSHIFQDAGLLSRLRTHLDESGISPDRLTFEITETSTIMNFTETRRMVENIRDLGCRFALDDFGSGFSSYHYLKNFPVDVLKIDGSFISGMRGDVRDQAIVKSMIDIGHCLDMEIVAEFVEDKATLRQLVRMGVNYLQGYLIGRPVFDPLPRLVSMEQLLREGT